MELLAPKAVISALFLGLLAPARPKKQAIAMETIACSHICIEKHSVYSYLEEILHRPVVFYLIKDGGSMKVTIMMKVFLFFNNGPGSIAGGRLVPFCGDVLTFS